MRLRVGDAQAVLVALVGATLLWAGYSKLTDIAGFRAAVRSQELLPVFVQGVVVWGTLLVEIGLGSAAVLAAIVRRRVATTGLAMAVLLGAFAVYGVAMIGWSPNASAACGCGIARADRANWAAIAAVDAAIATLLAVLAIASRGGAASDSAPATGEPRMPEARLKT